MTDPAAKHSAEPLDTDRVDNHGGGFAKRSFFGLVWNMTGTLGGRLAALLAHFALARLLTPTEFGLFGQAMAIAAVAIVMQNFGLQDVLVQRRAMFEAIVPTARRIAVTIGIAAALLLALAAYPVGMVLDEPRVVPLVLILSCAVLINGFAAVPLAKLRIDMRFRDLAGMELALIILLWGLSVALAFAGLGALAFVIPHPVVALARVAVTRRLAGPLPQGRANRAISRSMLGDASKSLSSSVANSVTIHAANLVLGIRFNSEVVGLFVFAFALSLQTLMPITVAFSNVLMPVFARMQEEPARLMSAWSRSTTALLLIGAWPLVFVAWQADPLVVMLFGSDWAGAAPLLSALCLGLMFRLVKVTSSVVMRATGQFGLLLKLNIGFSIVYLTAIGIAASIGTLQTVAVTAAVIIGGFGPVSAAVATRSHPRVLAFALIRWVQQILLAGASVVGASVLVPMTGVPSGAYEIGTQAILSAAVYGLISLALNRRDLMQLWNMLVKRNPGTASSDGKGRADRDQIE